jgi:formylglycine-generating enzyme required for sulfatase activity/serine/threonine protein kinase
MAARDPLGITGQLIAEKYRVEILVGEGGFASVYRAQHIIWNKPVAIKFFTGLSQAPRDQREELQRAFVQEGALLTELSAESASIVQARDVGAYTTAAGQWVPYLVLEWLDGKPLEAILDQDRLQQQPWSVEDSVGFLARVLPALQVAHRRGVAHRDVKPANLFVLGSAARSSQTPIKLLDFGVAKMVSDNTQIKAALAKTGVGVSSFTPKYGAPEQFARSYGATGPWTDVYAMALVAVEMLTCKDALEGDDIVQLGFCTGNPERRPTPRARGADVPDALEAVFQRALAVHPEERYANAGEMLQAVMAAASNTGQVPQSWPAPSMPRITGAYEATVLDARAAAGALAGRMPSRPDSALPRDSNPRDSNPRGSSGTGPVTTYATGGAGEQTIPAKKSGGWFSFLLALLVVVAGATIVYSVSGLRGSDQTRDALMAVAQSAKDVAQSAKDVAQSARNAAEGLSGTSQPDARASASALGSSSAAPSASGQAAVGCPEGMVAIAAGSFAMGLSSAEPPDSNPRHQVTLSGYCIDKFEVTVERYRQCVTQGKCKPPSNKVEWPKLAANERKAYEPLCTYHSKLRGNFPLNCIDWEAASAFCKARGGNLPTEAQWEYAARGPAERLYPWGDDEPNNKYLNACGKECTHWSRGQRLNLLGLSNTDDGYATLAPVGKFAHGRSGFGLYDMAGNVAEWVFDNYGPYADADATDPQGPATGVSKVVRGAAWTGSYASHFRNTRRASEVPNASRADLGFRCAQPLP